MKAKEIKNIKSSEDMAFYIANRVKTVALKKLSGLDPYLSTMIELFFDNSSWEGEVEDEYERPVSIKRVGFRAKNTRGNQHLPYEEKLFFLENDLFTENAIDIFRVNESVTLPSYAVFDDHDNHHILKRQRYAVIVSITDKNKLLPQDLINAGFVKHPEEDNYYILTLDPSGIGYRAIGNWRKEQPSLSEDDRDFSVVVELWNPDEDNADHTFFSINLTYYSQDGYSVNSINVVTPKVEEVIIYSYVD